MHKHTTINFPALGPTLLIVDHYVPNTICLQDGTTRPYGVMIDGTVFVSPNTFHSLEAGNLDLIAHDFSTISLVPNSRRLDRRRPASTRPDPSSAQPDPTATSRA
jgi:hypothetical protein